MEIYNENVIAKGLSPLVFQNCTSITYPRFIGTHKKAQLKRFLHPRHEIIRRKR
jgi:hypothetical protein